MVTLVAPTSAPPGESRSAQRPAVGPAASSPARPQTQGDALATDLSRLIAALRANTAAYLAGRSSDDRAAMELFRRAVVERNDVAWGALHDAYLPLVTAWVTRHTSLARCGEDADYLVNRAFERFWRALRPGRMADFPNVSSLLGYLKACAHGAVLDAARSSPYARCDSLDRVEIASAGRGDLERTEARIRAEQLWGTVVAVLANPVSERLAWDTLVLGMSPRQVLDAHPDEWRSIEQVYEAKAALLRRLRSSPELAALRPGERSGAPEAPLGTAPRRPRLPSARPWS